ncbi:hypothetical protein G195_011368 [Phytophthora kernoviae 00238/432]|uniref:Uncharacterized protein n=2 Tax=Phytophthora kernoviae TaxID=325452 RepID=A0A8J4RPH7_9STRA|nr:hypothetical protein G195_011368 [Phytophthora kernoviae 00238/432]
MDFQEQLVLSPSEALVVKPTEMQPKTKKRKTAYEIRKERRHELEVKAQQLQNELDGLKFRMLVEQGEVTRANKCTQAMNTVLHEFIQEQHLKLANAQTMLTGHVQRSLDTLQPTQSVIRLGKSQKERYKTLMALKERQLSATERYLTVRSLGLDPKSPYCQEERFNTPNGDYCFRRFEIAPVRGTTAKTVFDGIVNNILNAEMILSGMFGCITIREDSDFENDECAQIRLVSSASTGATVESNTILFSRFVAGKDNGESSYGVIASDYVDFDELYPYRTKEFVRRDATTIVMLN